MYNYLEDNPTIEQTKKNVRELAITFAEQDLKQSQEKLGEENKKALQAKK